MAEINNLLKERGFLMGTLVTIKGLTHEAKERVDYVHLEDWKSMGKLYDHNLTNKDKTRGTPLK